MSLTWMAAGAALGLGAWRLLRGSSFGERIADAGDLVPFCGFGGSAGVVNLAFTRWGGVTATFRYYPPDGESMSDSELEEQFANAVRHLRRMVGVTLHFDAERECWNHYFEIPEGRWLVGEALEEERRAELCSGRYLTSRYFVSLTWAPPPAVVQRIGKLIFSGGARPRAAREAISASEAALADFQKVLMEFESAIGGFWRVERLEGDEFLGYLRRVVTGQGVFAFRGHPGNVSADQVLGVDVRGGIYPGLGDRDLRVVGLRGFPPSAYMDCLEQIGRLPFPTRLSVRWSPLSAAEAGAILAAMKRSWTRARFDPRQLLMSFGGGQKGRSEDSEETKVWAKADAGKARLEVADFEGRVAGEETQGGRLLASVILTGSTPEEADENAEEVRRTLMRAGFTAEIERVAALERWAASLPGGVFEAQSKSVFTVQNAAQMVPLVGFPAGESTCPSDFFPTGSPALGITTFAGGRHVGYFNLHFGQVGSALVFGPSGSGKSTFLAWLMTQFLVRYPDAEVSLLDYAMSNRLMVEAFGGRYFQVEAGGVGFQPLRRLDSEEDLAVSQLWAERLVEGAVQRPLEPRERAVVSSAVALLVPLSPDDRTLTAFSLFLTAEGGLQEALRPFLHGGPLGDLYDSVESGEGLAGNLVGVDTTELASFSVAQKGPLMAYLLRALLRSVRSSAPRLLVFDEAWSYLADPVWSKFIREMAVLGRKYGTAIVIATQAPAQLVSTAEGSNSLQEIRSSIPSIFCFADRNAGRDDGYLVAGLNEEERARVERLERPGQALFRSGDRRGVVDVRLSAAELAMLTSGKGRSLKKALEDMERMKVLFGKEWPEEWLGSLGHERAAENIRARRAKLRGTEQ